MKQAHQLIDKDSLATFLTENLHTGGDLDVAYYPHGYSNETIFLRWGDTDLVLRRPPEGETADRAHDILREYNIYSKLQETAVPVPNTVASCDDRSIIGSEFYLMERVEGETFHEGEPATFKTQNARRKCSREFIETLATIHTLDYNEASLADLGKSTGFTERQIDQWTTQLDWATGKTAAVRHINGIERIQEWLEENEPETTVDSLVHGDYTFANVMFGIDSPSDIVAVFDWEMGTLGDPFTDLGWTLAVWRDPDDPPNPAPEFLPAFTVSDGYFTREEFINRYEVCTGFDFTNRTFYRVFGYYKLVAICEMFFARYLDGEENEIYPKMEEYVPRIVSRATDIINRQGSA
jgi:aminoglycoside phosphotransferase (APT) family kinase protein